MTCTLCDESDVRADSSDYRKYMMMVGRIITVIINISVFFFFSSRRRHTRFDCDWSSDVCSSDLEYRGGSLHSRFERLQRQAGIQWMRLVMRSDDAGKSFDLSRQGAPRDHHAANRSEERRVGKECRSRWSPDH